MSFDRTPDVYNYFWDYDPSIGRYVQSDPIGIMMDAFTLQHELAFFGEVGMGYKPKFSGLNHLYNYTDQNPINKTDPFGLSPNPWDHKIYPPETNCSCTLECKEKIIGSGKSLLVGAACGKATIPIFGGVVCNSIITMVCGNICRDECDGENDCDENK